MPFDLEAFFDNAEKLNIPGFNKAEALEEVGKRGLRQDEFSRRLSVVDTKEADLQKRWKSNDDFQAQLEAASQKLLLVQQLEAKFGPAEQWNPALAASLGEQHPELREQSPNFTLAQVQEAINAAVGPLKQELQQVARGAAIMIDFAPAAERQWEKEFGVPFPKKEFSTFFNDPQTGISDPWKALDNFAIPHRATKQAEDHKKALADADLRGYQRGASKAGTHEPPPGQQPGMLFTSLDAPVDPTTGKAVVTPTRETTTDEVRSRVSSAYHNAMNAAGSGRVALDPTGSVIPKT